MTSEPGWEHYRTFLAVVRERSLSGAGRALGVAQPTIGRRVQALEQALGVALFTRSQLGLDPTPAALALVSYAETMASAASALRRAASGEAQELRGSVRITASEAIGTEVLPAALAAFRELHPGITVELVISNRNQDLLRRDADIAIRNVQGPLVTRKVGVLQVGLHAHPGYLRAHGTPHTLAQLREHPLIGFDTEAGMTPANVPVPVTRELFSLRCDDEIVQYAALRAGFGIGVCQVALARRDGLVRVLPDAVAFPLGSGSSCTATSRPTAGCRRCSTTSSATCSTTSRPSWADRHAAGGWAAAARGPRCTAPRRAPGGRAPRCGWRRAACACERRTERAARTSPAARPPWPRRCRTRWCRARARCGS